MPKKSRRRTKAGRSAGGGAASAAAMGQDTAEAADPITKMIPTAEVMENGGLRIAIPRPFTPDDVPQALYQALGEVLATSTGIFEPTAAIEERANKAIREVMEKHYATASPPATPPTDGGPMTEEVLRPKIHSREMVADLPRPPQAVISDDDGVFDDSPYSRRLELARAHLTRSAHLFDGGDGDISAALECLIGFFRIPRAQTEPFRAPMLTQWRMMLGTCATKAHHSDDVGVKIDMSNKYDKFFVENTRAKRLLKFLSSEESGETMITRAIASFIRSQSLTRYRDDPCPLDFIPIEVDHLRRFIAWASDSDLNAMGLAVNDLLGFGNKRFGDSVLPMGQLMVKMYRDESSAFLKIYEGPSQASVSSLDEIITSTSPSVARGILPSGSQDSYPYYLTLGGGYCDCCGKTPREVGRRFLWKCRACHLAWYCSSSCQAKCWANGHRNHCKKVGCFEKDDTVIVFGLMNQVELNGAMVVVNDAPGSERIVVRVLRYGPFYKYVGPQIGKVVSIKKGNLRHHRPLK